MLITDLLESRNGPCGQVPHCMENIRGMDTIVIWKSARYNKNNIIWNVIKRNNKNNNNNKMHKIYYQWDFD